MTNPETKSQYEGAILNQLVRNVEKIAVIETVVQKNSQKLDDVEKRLSEIEKLLGWLKIIGSGVVAIALSLIANFIYSYII